MIFRFVELKEDQYRILSTKTLNNTPAIECVRVIFFKNIRLSNLINSGGKRKRKLRLPPNFYLRFYNNR